jgi:aconitate hydratase
MVNGLGVLGLGRGRHRGRGGDARAAGRDADPRGHRLQADRQAQARRTATDLVLTCTEMLRKKKVVGKFVEYYGRGSRRARPRRPRDDREHGAGVRRDDGLLPRGPRDAQVPAPLGAQRRAGGLVERTQGAGALPHQREPDPALHRHARTRPRRRWCPRSPAPSVRRIASRSRGMRRTTSRRSSASSPATCPKTRRAAKAGWTAARRARGDEKAKGGTRVRPWISLARLEVAPRGVRSSTSRTARSSSPPSRLHQHQQPERDARRRPARQKAVERGLTVKPWVKTSLAPGSQVVTRLLRQGRRPAGARQDPASRSSATAAPPASATRVRSRSRSARRSTTASSRSGSVLSGNRNFEGRVNPQTASTTSPRRRSSWRTRSRAPSTSTSTRSRSAWGRRQARLPPRHLAHAEEVSNIVAQARQARAVREEVRRRVRGDARVAGDRWHPTGFATSGWDESTYVKHPPYFDGLSTMTPPGAASPARACLGCSVTRSPPTTSRLRATIAEKPGGQVPPVARRDEEGLQLSTARAAATTR